MCVAIPLEVVEVRDDPASSLAGGAVALVRVGGGTKTVRLDIVDRLPEPGEFVIVHAGFAIHTLSAADAQASLELFRQAQAGGLMDGGEV